MEGSDSFSFLKVSREKEDRKKDINKDRNKETETKKDGKDERK